MRASFSVCTASWMCPADRLSAMREEAERGQEKSLAGREGDRGTSKRYPMKCENMNI